ncbi:MAG: hypothetical protein ACOY3E_03655 [Pseudomonadota bacterium]
MDLFDVFQQFRIRQAESSADRAAAKASDAAIDVRMLQQRLDHLSLVCLAMWEMLEENGYSKERLFEKIERIDLKDGRRDGKVAMAATHCDDCGRKVSPRHLNCFYCGARVSHNGIL